MAAGGSVPEPKLLTPCIDATALQSTNPEPLSFWPPDYELCGEASSGVQHIDMEVVSSTAGCGRLQAG